jgi:uncharacterized protein YyaL (SSP411 family)
MSQVVAWKLPSNRRHGITGWLWRAGLSVGASGLLLLLAASGCNKPQPAAKPALGGHALTDEGSAYLRMHAGNPIAWQPWSDAVLARAKSEDKLVFVSSGYSSCHWCHVMEQEVFNAPEVAELMNASFICIKVDREEQPELDAQLLAIQTRMAEETGWPLNVWFTPHMKPVFAASGMTVRNFMLVTQRLVKLNAEDPARLAKAGDETLQSVRAALPVEAGAVSEQTIQDAVRAELAAADPDWGGQLAPQKFILPPRLRFLVQEYRFSGDEALGRHLRLTLDRMADGAVYDHIGGGFFRYSTDTQWNHPHYEKLLSLNAQLASLYLEASAAFDEPRYEAIAKDILDFLLRDMQDPEGGFYGSISAQSSAGEGAYYQWTANELVHLAGDSGGHELARVYGLADPDSLDPSAHDPMVPGTPNRRKDLRLLAQELGLDADAVAKLPETWRPALVAARSKRLAPPVDHKFVTAWNGQAISALSMVYLRSGDERYLAAAEKAAQHVLQLNGADGGTLLRATTDGRGSHPAGLDDLSLLANGLFDLYQTSNNIEWLKSGLELADRANGIGMRGSVVQGEGSSLTKLDLGETWIEQDGPEPSGGAVYIDALLHAAILTGKTGYADMAAQQVKANGGSIAKAGIEAAWWLRGARLLLSEPRAVVIAGDAVATLPLLEIYTNVLPSDAVLLRVPQAVSMEQATLQPILRDKQTIDGQPTAYVCTLHSCLQPVTTPDALLQLIRRPDGKLE